METRRDERVNKLAHALKRIDKIHLKDAARLLGVSEMTIRRDLNEQPSTVVLLGGYIVSDPRISHGHYFVSDQQSQNVSKKQQLAQLAATLINANDTVFFDCGTTIPYVIDAIDDSLPFTAICCAMNTFLALKEKSGCHVILSGGEFHADNAIFTPLGQNHVLDDLCPSLAFISAAGIDVHQGATCYNINELQMKHHALQRAQHKILLADSSKFGKVLPARIGELDLFDTLISDSAPPKALAQTLKAAEVNVISL
ncbi:DNA-binding transcriptional repressor DeoR [Erwiniaceae bacterium BAC15a-03b]|uniref:DNA-binding transcriptional repressor DeoR n=1 Tax=Winslowiella arboricola TaxID=2978220 RepID=A0A9J6PLT7_9GAMM|nr:DNA-binding transcriptional repressor DeoR [Winslowiella arboricola]MCU5771905.1 DNA-binding transcriptional repressor DeoR [Winslowiella arboricola]MCU5778338.1 DNA-binding transcriptional repressor DeoR [Winslowiella arboricola]